MGTVPAVGAGTGTICRICVWRASLVLLPLIGGCVEKAPPPLWPAPPPPSVATPITRTTPSAASTADASAPVSGVGEPSRPAPPEVGAPDATILDPASPAAAAVLKASPSQARPVPGHK